jgi:hypothetical protein
VGHDPPTATRELEQVLLARQDVKIVPGGIGLVRQEPLELEATSWAVITLALADSCIRATFRAGEPDRREALFGLFSAHGALFGADAAFLLPLTEWRAPVLDVRAL